MYLPHTITKAKIQLGTRQRFHTSYYSNTTLSTTINNTDLCSSEDMSLGIESQDLKNQDTNSISFNQTELEANTSFMKKTELTDMS